MVSIFRATPLRLALLISLAWSPFTIAEEGEAGWVLELEPLYLWLVDGDDSYRPATEVQQVWDGANFGPVASVRAIDSNFDNDEFTFRGELQRRRDDRWGYGAMGWWFETDASTVAAAPSGTVGVPFLSPPGSTAAGVDVPSMRGTMTPIGNDGLFLDNIFNELSFQAKSDFDLWKVDIHGMRELGEYRPERTWDFLFGIELVEINANRREMVRSSTPRIADPAVADDITLVEHDGRLDYGIAVGPMLGLQYERRADQHRFKALITQSLVFADEGGRAEVTQTSQQATAGGAIVTTASSRLGLSRNDGTDALPITEVKLAYNYDFTPEASLGLGGFLSVWWDAPMAPGLNKSNGETLVFLGLFVSGQIRFD